MPCKPWFPFAFHMIRTGFPYPFPCCCRFWAEITEPHSWLVRCLLNSLNSRLLQADGFALYCFSMIQAESADVYFPLHCLGLLNMVWVTLWLGIVVCCRTWLLVMLHKVFPWFMLFLTLILLVIADMGMGLLLVMISRFPDGLFIAFCFGSLHENVTSWSFPNVCSLYCMIIVSPNSLQPIVTTLKLICTSTSPLAEEHLKSWYSIVHVHILFTWIALFYLSCCTKTRSDLAMPCKFMFLFSG